MITGNFVHGKDIDFSFANAHKVFKLPGYPLEQIQQSISRYTIYGGSWLESNSEWRLGL